MSDLDRPIPDDAARHGDADRPDPIDAWLDGEADDADFAALDAALAVDPEQARRLMDLALVHHGLGRIGAAPTAAGIDTFTAGAPRRLTRLPRLAVALAAAVVVAGGAVVLYLATVGDSERSADSGAGGTVATLIGSTGPVYVDDALAHPGTEYAAGTFVLDSGAADFMLTNAVQVRLAGRTRLTVHDPMAATLTTGHVSFDCPPSTVGFTVRLPGATRIVDLGTRFEVRLDPARPAEVEVAEGAVRVDPPASGAWEAFELRAGWLCEVYVDEPARRPRVYRRIEVANASFEADGDDVRKVAPTGWRSGLPVRVYIHPALSKEARVDGAAGRFVGTLNAFYAGHDPEGVAPDLWQDLDERVQAGATYTLRFLVGRRADYDRLKMPPTHWRVELADAESGAVLAELAGASAPTGQMEEHALTYTPALEHAGRPMRLRLVNPMGTTAPGNGKILYDDIRLTAHGEEAGPTPSQNSTPRVNTGGTQ